MGAVTVIVEFRLPPVARIAAALRVAAWSGGVADRRLAEYGQSIAAQHVAFARWLETEGLPVRALARMTAAFNGMTLSVEAAPPGIVPDLDAILARLRAYPDVKRAWIDRTGQLSPGEPAPALPGQTPAGAYD